MNYNQNPGVRNPQGLIRKPKRVSDVNAVGPSAPMNANASPYMQAPAMNPMNQQQTYGVQSSAPNMAYGGGDMYNNGAAAQQQATAYNVYSQEQRHMPSGMQQQPYAAASQAPYGMSAAPQATYGMPAAPAAYPNQLPTDMPPFAMLQQPIVQDMAMQYGQRLADQGKQLVENQVEKWVPVSKLKYYFAVDNSYVINKLRLLLFPFAHKEWSLKYDQENPVQPRYDINAPDLYIPTMAYITYVVVAGLMLGLQQRFTPEQLGIQASSALAYCIFELVVYSIALYVVNIKTSLKTLDLLAFCGYKFVIIVACLLMSTIFYGMGYYCMLLYSSLALGFFLLRTLTTKILYDTAPTATTGAINYDPYGNPQQMDYRGGRKRKLYFLFMIVGFQTFLSFWLSKHLYFPDPRPLAVEAAKVL